MSDHFELSPDNGWFMLSVPAAIVLSGLLMAAVAKYRRRSPYFVHGRGSDLDTRPPAATALQAPWHPRLRRSPHRTALPA